MAFAGVHDRQGVVAPRGEQLPIGLDHPAELRHVVAEHFAETSRLQEIALQVDQQQGAGRRDELERVRFRLHRD